MIFQRWQLNSASKQVSWRNESKLHSEASKPTSKFLYQQFSSSKSELEDFMQVFITFFSFGFQESWDLFFLLFSVYVMNEYHCFPMHISYDCCWWLLERTLNYCCEQSIVKFNIKTGVVIYELVKQLSLIIVADLRYYS